MSQDFDAKSIKNLAGQCRVNDNRSCFQHLNESKNPIVPINTGSTGFLAVHYTSVLLHYKAPYIQRRVCW